MCVCTDIHVYGRYMGTWTCTACNLVAFPKGEEAYVGVHVSIPQVNAPDCGAVRD